MSGFFSILASNLVRCVLRVAASILRTSSHHASLRVLCVLCVSASLFRNFSHHVHQLRVAASLFRHSGIDVLVHAQSDRMSLLHTSPRLPPCLRSLYSPCFAEGISASDKSLHPCTGCRRVAEDAEP